MPKALLLFKTTRHAIKAEKLCKNHWVDVRVVPVPRNISSECGMSLELDEHKRQTAVSLLENNDIPVDVHLLKEPI